MKPKNQVQQRGQKPPTFQSVTMQLPSFVSLKKVARQGALSSSAQLDDKATAAEQTLSGQRKNTTLFTTSILQFYCWDKGSEKVTCTSTEN